MGFWTVKNSRNAEIDDKTYLGFEEKLQKKFKEKWGDGKVGNNKLHLFSI